MAHSSVLGRSVSADELAWVPMVARQLEEVPDGGVVRVRVSGHDDRG